MTVHDAIEKLGGTTKVAAALDRGESTIRSWRDKGRIPRRHDAQDFCKYLCRKLKLDPEEFNFQWAMGVQK